MSCEKVNDKPRNLNDQEIRICEALYKKFNNIKSIDKNCAKYTETTLSETVELGTITTIGKANIVPPDNKINTTNFTKLVILDGITTINDYTFYLYISLNLFINNLSSSDKLS